MTPIEMLEAMRGVISAQYELLRKEMNIKQLQGLLLELEEEVIQEQTQGSSGAFFNGEAMTIFEKDYKK